MILSFFLATLLATGGLFQQVSPMATDELSYRVLYSSNRPGGRSIGYVVSVDHLLDRNQIEKLICRVLLNEKAPTSSIVGVSIYYKLDKYVPTGGLPNLEAELREHDVADYLWNADFPGARKRLTVIRDAKGNILDPPQANEFDHTTACR